MVEKAMVGYERCLQERSISNAMKHSSVRKILLMPLFYERIMGPAKSMTFVLLNWIKKLVESDRQQATVNLVEEEILHFIVKYIEIFDHINPSTQRTDVYFFIM